MGSLGESKGERLERGERGGKRGEEQATARAEADPFGMTNKKATTEILAAPE
jgi:hypothetical protein